MPASRTARRTARPKRSTCPVSRTLDVLGDRWSLLVVRDLMRGKQRFAEFLESKEGIPTNTLAERLKRLVRAGIVESHRYSEHPPRLEYLLTSKARNCVRSSGRWSTGACGTPAGGCPSRSPGTRHGRPHAPGRGARDAAPGAPRSRPRGHCVGMVFPRGLALLCLAVYSNAFGAGFALDNRQLILRDPRVHAFTRENLSLILNHTYWWPYGESGLYRPLTTFTYLFNYAVLGNADRPAGYHWFNLLSTSQTCCSSGGCRAGSRGPVDRRCGGGTLGRATSLHRSGHQHRRPCGSARRDRHAGSPARLPADADTRIPAANRCDRGADAGRALEGECGRRSAFSREQN